LAARADEKQLVLVVVLVTGADAISERGIQMI
jgi:hypothetical protein